MEPDERPEADQPEQTDSAPRDVLDHARLNDLFTLAYEELRRLASTLRRSESSATVQTTALLHEAWLKLASSPRLRAIDELHFKRIAVRAMRQVLIDAARRRRTSKHGAEVITLDNELAGTTDRAEQILALDEALTRLVEVNPRQAQMVEARFFGGLDVMETARVLEISEATVMRDWRLARAWLSMEIRSAHLPE